MQHSVVTLYATANLAVSVHRSIGLSVYRSIGLSLYRSIALSVSYITELPIAKSSGNLV